MAKRPTLTSISAQLSAHIKDCGETRTRTNAALEKVAAGLDEIKGIPMKAIRWIGGLIVVATVTGVVQNAIQHRETVQQTQAATQQAKVAADVAETSAANIIKKVDHLAAAPATN